MNDIKNNIEESNTETNHDISDRFIYKKGDIRLEKSQCCFCKFFDSKNSDVCENYPEGIPTSIVNTNEKCKYFEIKDDNNGIKKDNEIE